MSDDAGAAKAGNIDNTTVNGMLSYALGGHKVSAAWQQLSGESAFPYVDGADPYLVNFVQINDFAGADERSWQARYDYNFAALGVPGLTFMTRYISGDNVSRCRWRRQRVGTQHRTEVRGTKRPVEERRRASAQRHLPLQLRP